jgi:hypothetical protein
MLAVIQFSEDDDMAFTLDRMFTRINPMRARLASGRCFVRFVVIGDQAQRRSICAALNQWMLSSVEKATGLSADFQSSLELTEDRMGTAGVGATRVGAGDSPAHANAIPNPAQVQPPTAIQELAPATPHPEQIPGRADSGANKNLHCPHPLPSGF